MLEPRQYAQWLHSQVFLPVVVVIGSDAAKDHVRQANGLSLGELFSPFGGQYQQISLTCQTLERKITIDNFRVRFADSETSSQWTAAHADQVAAYLVETSATAGHKQLEKALEPPSPWYEQWRTAMLRSLRWSEHEGLDQPAAALLVVLSKEPDPVGLLEQLLHSSNMPPLCTQGVLDPVPARAAILLHDLSDPDSPSQEQLQEKLERVKTRFNPHLAIAVEICRGGVECHLPEVEETFKPYLASKLTPPPPPAPPGSEVSTALKALPGARLTKDDLGVLAQAATEVITRSAVPWMEGQLQQLEGQISQSRKGFRNQLKYLWRKPREGAQAEKPVERSAASEDSAVVYPLHAVEGQMRLAGDIAFHLRDYEAALSYYRNVVSDFKQDKSWKHAAGAYEMWGLCGYITGAPRSEWSRCMESAYEHYLQASAGRHAMRAVALHQAMLSDCKEAASRLMKVNGDLPDGGLRSALILEQAGQLYCSAGWARKGCFHLVLAGHTFNKLGFKRLALSSYQVVAHRYFGKGWFHVTDHFHFTMARQAFGLGLVEESLHHFLELLNSFNEKKASVAAEREATYVKEFLFVVKNWLEKNGKDTSTSVDLKVPLIGQHIAVILLDDLRTPVVEDTISEPSPVSPFKPAAPTASSIGTSEEAVLPPPSSWEQLGLKALRNLSSEERQELRFRSRHPDPQLYDSLRRSVAVGAEVKVEIELSNPLRMKLDLFDARLRGSLKDTSEEIQECDSVEFSSQDISLAPLETRRIHFTAVASKEGLLSIEGVKWKLFDQVFCDRPLKLPGRRLRTTLEQRSSKMGVRSVDLRLEVRVRSLMPRLQSTFECSHAAAAASLLTSLPSPVASPSAADALNPSALLQGEYAKCSLAMRNTIGSAHIQRISVSLSHSSFLSFDIQTDSFPKGIVVESETSGQVLNLKSTLPSGLFADQVNPDLRIPVLLRAAALGRHLLRVLVIAEGQDGVGALNAAGCRQFLTLEEEITVRPSIALTARPSPSFRQEDRILFACTLENRALEVLEVSRISCTDGKKDLPLEECVVSGCEKIVGPGQVAQLIYSLHSRLEVPDDLTSQESNARQFLRNAARAEVALSSSGREAVKGRNPDSATSPSTVDLIAEWRFDSGTGIRCGEVSALNVPRERPEAAPCPLDLHVLAAEEVRFREDEPLMVPVTLKIRNASLGGPVTFYFVADSSIDVAWLGCERSAAITLSAQSVHTASLFAYFNSPGIFNLNRFRLFVVGMPPGVGSVPASEQAPLAFAFPFERLVHVQHSRSNPDSS